MRALSGVLGLLAAIAVAAGYRIVWPPAVDARIDVLGLTIAAALAALVASGIGDYLQRVRNAAGPADPDVGLLILRNVVFAVATGWLVAALALHFAEASPISDRAVQMQYTAVAFLSGAVAYGELISRYRDAPARLLAADPTIVYLCVNIAAGTAALALVKEFGAVTTDQHRSVYETLLAGFGAIAFFRSSLFTIRVSGTDIGVGPSTLLKALLDSSDMMLNRWQAMNRGAEVRRIMDKVNFAKAKTALATTCFTLMTEFPPETQAGVADQIKKLDGDKTIVDDDAKKIILGIFLVQQVGTEVLDRAVKTLGPTIE